MEGGEALPGAALSEEGSILRVDTRLKKHLLDNYSIGEHELDMLVDDISEYWNCSLQEFVVQRHGELQRSGLSNTEIYRRIEQELPQRRFTAPPLSIRQIRRIIYG